MNEMNDKKIAFSIIGTRPQIIKATIIHKRFQKLKNYKHIIFDTGQHYDANMFKNFINEYQINPKDIIFLKCENKNKNIFKKKINNKILPYFKKFKPSLCIVYGDTISTLIAAEIIKKNKIKIAHIESGARSFDKRMIEEKIRKKVDHISDLLFCCTKKCKKNLINEKINKNKIFLVGDILFDIFKKNINKLKIKKSVTKFNFLTLHRRENLSSKERLESIFKFLINISKFQIIFPAHPHTIQKIKKFNIKINEKIKIINPINHLKLLNFLYNSKNIFTDSGGVQREAYFLKKPTIVLRDKIEWVELLKYGKQKQWNSNSKFSKYKKNLLGDGKASKKIIEIILNKT